MRTPLILVSAALTLALGGSSAGIPPVPEMLDAARLVALGDPAAPRDGLVSVSTIEVPPDPNERCTAFPRPPSIPVVGQLGQRIAYNSTAHTVRSIGVADHGPERVWLVARIETTASGCSGRGSVWEFLFVAADGTIHQPVPQGRRGEYTQYDIPAGRRATGLVFFDLPRSALHGGAVGFRETPFINFNTYAQAILPYGLWPVPASPPEARQPHTYPRVVNDRPGR